LSYKEERDELIRKYASQPPGEFDFNEARKCYDAALQSSVVRGLVEAAQAGRVLAKYLKAKAIQDGATILSDPKAFDDAIELYQAALKEAGKP
jgi:hypothetical protein